MHLKNIFKWINMYLVFPPCLTVSHVCFLKGAWPYCSPLKMMWTLWLAETSHQINLCIWLWSEDSYHRTRQSRKIVNSPKKAPKGNINERLNTIYQDTNPTLQMRVQENYWGNLHRSKLSTLSDSEALIRQCNPTEKMSNVLPLKCKNISQKKKQCITK